MTKLAKVEDIEQVDKTINSLVRVLKEMTSELKIQHVCLMHRLIHVQSKEKAVRDEDDNDNRLIILWSVVEAITMIVVAVIQVYSIRKYLKQKQVIS